MTFGKIESFEVGVSNWDAYCRRIKQFIALNNIDKDLHVATLVTHVGVNCYELMCDLCAPDLPEQKSFEELETIVRQHLEPQRSEIAERHAFRQRKQRTGETVSEYLQNLKHLAKTCNFRDHLEVNLRDQFVSGLHDEAMRSRLFAERNVDYRRAVELALALEAAERHAAAAGGAADASGGEPAGAEGLHRVQAPARSARAARPCGGAGAAAATGRPRACPRCGREGHAAARCRFKNYTCDVCGQKGHLRAVCNRRAATPGTGRGQFFLNDSDDSDVSFFNLSTSGSDEPYLIHLNVSGKILNFEIDTGSKISAISKECYDKYFSNIQIVCKALKLKSYTGSVIKPLGYIVVDVSYLSIRKSLELYIIENGGPPLMGRTWIRHLKLDFKDYHCHSLADSNIDDCIKSLCKDFPEVFAGGLGTFKSRMSLHLANSNPVFIKARPLPLALRGPVERELERLQRDDVIYKVERSDYGTPIVPIIKKNGEIRICGDYKITINPLLKDFHYPLPRIEDIFATLAGGEQYSKLDLSHAYQQILLTEESQPMTAITTHIGTFVYKRVPFGIKCVPEYFEKLIEETLSGLPSTVAFQDDICVTGSNKETHLKNLRAVLSRLRKAGLRVNFSKCEFFKNSVSYLGYRIDKNGLHTDERKIEAIVAAPSPRDVTELKSFLGLVNFYAKFCPNISEILKPLYGLLKKGIKWLWSENCENAFNKIKRFLSSGPVLAHYDARLPLILSVDSSAYGLGAVLLQRYADGSERPVSCASRTLTPSECNYSQIDKEALAILFGVSKHHQYVYGRRFILRSDHRPLSYIFGKNKGLPQTAASRLQRYAVRLSAYNFDIEFVPSNKNCFADALSRLPLEGQLKKNVDISVSYLHFIEDKLPVTYQKVQRETKNDLLLNKIIGYVKFGWPNNVSDPKEKPFFNRRENLFIENDCLVWGYRIVIPNSLRAVILEELHGGHIGVVKMKQVARNYVWWDGVDTDVERVCRECRACSSQRDEPPRAPLQPWSWPADPWARLNVDFLGPYRGRYYLVILDAHSKWLEVENVSSTSARAVITCFRKLFARFGLPKCIVSDNGPPFSSAEYQTYLNKNGIKRTLVAPYHPSSNGAAENAVRIVKRVLKKATVEGVDCDLALCKFLFSYRNTEHCTTQKEPSVALLGRRLRGRLDLLRPDTSAIVSEAQRLQTEAHDARGARPRRFESGDPVLVRDYSNKDVKWKEGVVTERSGPVSYKVKTIDNMHCRRHVDQLIGRKSRHSLSRAVTEPHNENNLNPTDEPDANKNNSFFDDGFLTPIDRSPNSVVVSSADDTSPPTNISEYIPERDYSTSSCDTRKIVLRPRKARKYLE